MLATESSWSSSIRIRPPTSSPSDHGSHHLWALLAAHPGTALVTGDRALLENQSTWATVIASADFVQNL